MEYPVRVFVSAADPVSQAGVEAAIGARPEFEVVSEEGLDDGTVAVVVVDEIDEETLRAVRSLQRGPSPRILLVTSKLDDGSLFEAIEAGIVGVLRREDADGDRLAEALRAAARGDGSVPPDLVGRLLEQIRRVQSEVLEPRGLTFGGLSDREVEVLRLVAEGRVTSEIADELSYSERTIKNVIHDVTSRLQLRNRSHAVAYALRQGLI